MSLFKSRSQPLVRHMRVDLRRCQRCVAEHFLHTAQVSTTLQQMGGHGVPQSVGTEIGRPLGHPEGPMDDPAYHTRVDPLAAIADEHCPAGLISHELGPGLRQPGIDGTKGRRTERNSSLFAALAEDSDHPAFPIKIIEVETA